MNREQRTYRTLKSVAEAREIFLSRFAERALRTEMIPVRQALGQPVTSGWLRDRKVGHIRSTGAAIVATANPGCQLLIQQGLAMGAGNGRGHPRVVHPAVLLAEAYRAETAGGGHSGG